MRVVLILFLKNLVIRRMDNIRFTLFLAFSVIILMLYQAWDLDYGPQPIPTEQTASGQPVAVDMPNATTAKNTNNALNNSQDVPLQNSYAEQLIIVETDVMRLEIDSKGGTLRNLDLLKYPKEKENTYFNAARKLIGLGKEKKDLEPIRLFNSEDEKLFLAQSGLIADSGSSKIASHHTIMDVEKTNYRLEEGQNSLRIPLTWTNENGVQVTKTYIFSRDSYLVQVEQKISNYSDKVWSGRQYTQLLKKPYTEPNANSFIRTYTGGVIYTEEDKYQKVDFEDMEDENLSVDNKGGWSAMIQDYFAAAWVPPAENDNHFYSKKLDNYQYVLGSYSSSVNVEPHSEKVLSSQLFVGPKIQPMMEKIATGLELTVDYGWLTLVGKPIYWLLNFIFSFVGNWGLSIMGVTLCIKLLFFKLSETSYKSMAKMRKIQPKLQQLKERYADDRQRFNEEMMGMYRKEKVNPLGGCLPIMVQIPVFISLYWVLIETVELRQTPFAFWLTDLSAKDPFFLLPVLMGITMKIQQSLNPAPIDPLQAKIMKMFPIVFTVFFLFFPSGLVLYWVVNNTLSIIQQWYITKRIEAED